MKLQGQRQSTNTYKVPELVTSQRLSIAEGSRRPPKDEPKNPLDKAVKSMGEKYKQTENEKALMPGITKAMDGAMARDAMKSRVANHSRYEGIDRKLNKEYNKELDKKLREGGLIKKSGKANPFAQARGK